MWTGVVLGAGVLFMASRHITQPYSRYATAHFGYAEVPGILAGQMRAGAEGDSAAAQLVVSTVLRAIGRGGTGTARVEAAPLAGAGQAWTQWTLGWPAEWGGWRRGAHYADIATLSGARPSTGPTIWTWQVKEGTLIRQTGSLGPTQTLAWMRAGALALDLMVAALIVFAMIQVKRRVRGGLARVCKPFAVIVAAALVLVPVHERGAIPNIYKPEDEPGLPTLGMLRALASKPGGSLQAAAELAGDRMTGDPKRPVVVEWFFTGENSRGFEFGWPWVWVRASTVDPPSSSPGGPDLAEYAVRWRRSFGMAEGRAVDRTGTVKGVEVFPGGVLASFAPVLLIALAPAGLWRLVRNVRRRRWECEGRCFNCGYTVGRSSERATAPDGRNTG